MQHPAQKTIAHRPLNPVACVAMRFARILPLVLLFSIMFGADARAADVGAWFAPDVIQKVTRRHQLKMGACLMLDSANEETDNYKIKLAFEVRGNGRVGSVRVLKTNRKLPIVERCLTKAVRSWRFPRPRDGKAVRVVYPLAFNFGD